MSIITYPATAANFATHSREDLALSIWEDYNSLHGIKPRGMGLWDESDPLSMDDLRGKALYYFNASWEQVIREREHEKFMADQAMRKANKKASDARKFDRGFNTLSNAF